jgi:hypothetical protein
MPQDTPPPRDKTESLSPSDTQRLREVRERLKRLERELSSIPGRRRTASESR